MILGLLFHFLGGFSSGSFYLPYKKVKGWNWENSWIVGGLFSWLIAPFIAAYITIPDCIQILNHAKNSVLASTYLLGILWGIGGLTYGLGVRYLGVSLGSSIILGLCSVFGALIPSVYYFYNPEKGKDTIYDLVSTSWGRFVLLGLFVCLIGIFLCGLAGSMREKSQSVSDSQSKNGNEFNLILGLIFAGISGVLSSCFSFGIESGTSLAQEVNQTWVLSHPNQGEYLYKNNIIFIVILLGGLTTNFIWCMYLNFKNKSFLQYTDTKVNLTRNYLYCALGGVTWYLQFFFYGMGESILGNGPSSWILHMSFIILVANLWGVVLKEWKSITKETFYTLLSGIAAIIFSIFIVGFGNSLK
jgi:L-rhamnose-H+ transport protein